MEKVEKKKAEPTDVTTEATIKKRRKNGNISNSNT